jgi:hypothetical protein
MRHEGQFKPADPRWARQLPDGRTLASLAREYTEESVNVLVAVVKGTMSDIKPSDRIRAAEILLDRGWGKAKETVQLELTAENLGSLTRDQLRAIAAGALRPPIEGEAAEVVSATSSLPPQGAGEQVS